MKIKDLQLYVGLGVLRLWQMPVKSAYSSLPRITKLVNVIYCIRWRQALGGDALKGKIDEPELGALPGCKLTSSPGQPLFDALAGSTPEVRLKIANVELAAILQVAKET